MTRFIRRFVLFAAIQLVLVTLIVCYGRPDRGDHYLSSMFDKYQLLVSARRPRLMVVGGSNVAFGINSEILADRLDYQPINLGLHVNLGLDFPLRIVEQSVRPDDVILLSPEYNVLITDNVHGSDDYIALMCQQWPPARHYFDKTQANLRSFLDQEGLRHAQLWLKRARRKMLGRDAKNPIYARSGFNRYGDMVAHHRIPRADPPDVYPLPEVSAEHLRLAVERLNRFHEICLSRGATVWFSYPPVPRAVLDQSEEVVSQIQREFKARLTIPLIHSPDEVSFPRDKFYDTIYHLTEEGAGYRSRLVCERLLLRLADAPSRPTRLTRAEHVQESGQDAKQR